MPNFKYVSTAEKKQRAADIKSRYAKKMKLLPVTVVAGGQKIAATWWGRSWIKNLEGYADYSSRLPRGRTYVRKDTVIHLEIEPGVIAALVAGSAREPYEVSITINPLKPRTRQQLIKKCRTAIKDLPPLLSGAFPAELEKAFLARGDGLFPSPSEIRFDCSCPDWADMCKHVAAVLYGTAVRLDQNPDLFFKLRGLDITDFIGTVIEKEKKDLLSKSNVKSKRIIPAKDATDLFGL